MTASDWLVVLAGAAGIGLVNWYFFVAGRRPVAAGTAPSGGAAAGHYVPAEVVVTVDGGYEPSTIRTAVGRPLRLVFDRRDTSSCSEEIVLPDFGVRRFLPSGQRTTVEITPAAAGTYEFTCGMSMLRGRIVAG